MKKLALAVTVLVAACSKAPTAATPHAPTASASIPSASSSPNAGQPVARVAPVVDTYFGVKIEDPYRWMEAHDNPELATWMKGQADYTRGVLDQRPDRASLLSRLKELDNSGESVSGGSIWGGKVFYMKRAPGDNVAKLCVRDGFAGEERVLVDPAALATNDVHYAIDWTAPSLDGSLVAVGISKSGSENSVLSILDVATGTKLPDTWDRMNFESVSWIDAKTFVYTRLQKLGAGAPDTDKYKNVRAYVHVLGADPDSDPAILGPGVSPDAPFTDIEAAYVGAPPGSKWVIGVVSDGVRNEETLYFAPRASLAGPKTPWKKLTDVAVDEVTGIELHGDDAYLLTHKDAPKFKIVKTSLAAPDVAHATVVVPESDVVLRGLGVAKDALYVSGLDAGLGRIKRVPFDGGALETVAMPFEGTIREDFVHPGLAGFLVSMTSWTESPRYFTYDPSAKTFTDAKLVAKLPVDFSGIVAEEVKAKSKDGTMVPLSILHRKDLAKDGTNRTWLKAYGAYGYTIDPEQNPVLLAWLEKGGVFAVCHIRGGGELGEAWHEAGMLANKTRGVEDVVGCGQYLIDGNYTSHPKIACEGGSAGGLLMSDVITRYPDFFAAAVVRVGISNVLRFEETANVLNTAEFGTVKTEDGFKALLEQDAYTHVKDGTAYPAVLLTTGATDPRVAPWQVTKMAARLEAATSSGKPVLLRVDYEAGHGIGSTASQHDEELADLMAFLDWQLQ